VKQTRLVFTSREELPEPFADEVIDLSRLYRSNAIELVHKAMTEAGLTPKEEDTEEAQPEVEALVESVNCHARSLVLLAPYVGEFGVRHTTENLGRLMAELDKQHPGSRELSLFASLELSLQRLPQQMREKIKRLGVFHGGASLFTFQNVLELTDAESDELLSVFIGLGLAEAMSYNFLSFHPALCPYLRRQLEATADEIEVALVRWVESMTMLCDFLYQQLFEDVQISATLTTLEMPNLSALLEHIAQQGDTDSVVGLATYLEQLISPLGKKHLLDWVSTVREAASSKLKGWSHTRFNAFQQKIERLRQSGYLNLALSEAQVLIERCVQAGDEAYPEAAYDSALAYLLLGRILLYSGTSESALLTIGKAEKMFQILADLGDKSAPLMAATCLTHEGDCLCELGRLDAAVEAYEAGIEISKKVKDLRQTAVGKAQLGMVRMKQQRYPEALESYREALAVFEVLGEPESVAVSWHGIGMIHDMAGEFEAAEQAYRESLAINVRQNNPVGEAESLSGLGLNALSHSAMLLNPGKHGIC